MRVEHRTSVQSRERINEGCPRERSRAETRAFTICAVRHGIRMKIHAAAKRRGCNNTFFRWDSGAKITGQTRRPSRLIRGTVKCMKMPGHQRHRDSIVRIVDAMQIIAGRAAPRRGITVGRCCNLQTAADEKAGSRAGETGGPVFNAAV